MKRRGEEHGGLHKTTRGTQRPDTRVLGRRPGGARCHINSEQNWERMFGKHKRLGRKTGMKSNGVNPVLLVLNLQRWYREVRVSNRPHNHKMKFRGGFSDGKKKPLGRKRLEG